MSYITNRTLPAQVNGYDRNQWLGRSWNSIFTGRYNEDFRGDVVVTYNDDLDKYRTPNTGLITPKAAGDRILFYSRFFLKYPQLFYYGSLPDRTGFPNYSHGSFVFEGIGHAHSLVAGFSSIHIETVALTRAFARYTDEIVHEYLWGIDLSAYVPADWMTANHRWICKMNKGLVEYRIDEALVAVVLYVPDSAFYTLAGPPYEIRLVPATYDPCEAQFHIHLEDNIPFEIPGFSDGEPLPLRGIPLYTTGTNTQWNGLATAGAVLTSHPVPVWGYPRKTLVFQADAAGNLDIQVYVGGGWRSWVPGGITLVANQLEVYNLNGETPLVRCVYTPTNADTITLAEWYLGGE